MNEQCNDNRYEMIEKYKNKLIEWTNIEHSEDEMKVIDSILFRLWQIDWLDRLEKAEAKKPIDIASSLGTRTLSCPTCKQPIVNVWSRQAYMPNYCHVCGQKFEWWGVEK